MSSTKKQKRKYLTLEKKIEVIKYAQKHPGANCRTLAETFECGKTQIGKILKDKNSLLTQYESNASGSRIHTSKSCRASEYDDVNKALYDWFLMAVSKNIHPSGPILIEKAKELANKLGKPNFKGSRGWLEKWKRKYNVHQMRVSGESGDVSGLTVSSWKERLPEIVKGYEPDDIWNMDESGVFWRALPENGFGQKGKQCKGGKKSKQRVTVAFFVTAAGNKEKPVFIWESETPRCLKRFDKSVLPVSYFNQSKAWMTGQIMEVVLGKLNRRLSASKRSILLFMDNAGCHPEDLNGKFSNIKVVFLPANTTSVLQPLDLGIIKNFKAYYCRYLLKYVLSKIDECDTATDVVKSVDILMALRWVATSWALVSAETIRKCFRKAGILTANMSLISTPITDTDPFLECDLEEELHDLIEQSMPSSVQCSVREYIQGDDNIEVCLDKGGDDWEAEFMAQFNPEAEEQEEQDEDDDIEMDVEPAPLKVTTYKQAVQCLEDVSHFLNSKGNIEAYSAVGLAMDMVAGMKVAASKQSSITDYFDSCDS